MQKTPLRRLPEDLPDQFRPLVQAAAVYNSSCSPQALVLYLDRDGGYYLKCAEQGRLELLLVKAVRTSMMTTQATMVSRAT